MSEGSKRRAFTLVEVLVSISLLAVGVVGTLMGLNSLTQTESRVQDREQMHRLASMKLEEIVATGDTQTASMNGDFGAEGQPDFIWSAETVVTGIENLEGLRVTVQRRGGTRTEVTLTTAIFTPTATEATTP